MYLEKSIVDQVIIFNKSRMTQKRSLIIATVSIKYNQAMSKTSNAEVDSIKILIIIKT